MSFGVRRTTNLSVQEYNMSVSGKRAAAQINLDEFERRLRSPGSQQTSLEDLLAVNSSALLRTRSPWPSQAVSMPGQTDIEPPRPLEIAALQPVVDGKPDKPTTTGSVDIEARELPNLAMRIGAIDRRWFGDGTTLRRLVPNGLGTCAGSQRRADRRGFRA